MASEHSELVTNDKF